MTERRSKRGKHYSDDRSEESPTEDEARVLGEESSGKEQEKETVDTDKGEEPEEDRRSKSRGRSRERKRRSRSPSREPREHREYREKRHRRDREPSRSGAFHDMADYFDQKFSSFRREMLDEQDHLAERIDKSYKPEHEFKRKTNRFQYDHNSEMTDTLKKAKKHLQKQPPNIKKAISVLDQGIAHNNFRTKCVLIADRYEGGWATVEEYLQRDLASDSEDDRRLRKAEQSVRQKQTYKKKAYKPRFNPYQNTRPQFQVPFQQPNFLSTPPPKPFNSFNGQRPKQNSKGVIGCFICGDFAHWKDACPRSGAIPAAAGAPPSSA